MLSRPFTRLRRRTAARASRAALLASLAAAALLPACASYKHHEPIGDTTPRDAATRETAHDLSYTTTSEIRFGDELVGYLVEVQPVPGGVVDERKWEPGTAIIEDTKFVYIGILSPHGTTYRYDADGQLKKVGLGIGEGRGADIATFFHRNGEPKLVPVTPGP
jgi:hypothetical protein